MNSTYRNVIAIITVLSTVPLRAASEVPTLNTDEEMLQEVQAAQAKVAEYADVNHRFWSNASDAPYLTLNHHHIPQRRRLVDTATGTHDTRLVFPVDEVPHGYNRTIFLEAQDEPVAFIGETNHDTID